MFDKLPPKRKIEVVMDIHKYIEEQKQGIASNKEFSPLDAAEKSPDEILNELENGSFSEVWKKAIKDKKVKGEADDLLQQLRDFKKKEAPKKKEEPSPNTAFKQFSQANLPPPSSNPQQPKMDKKSKEEEMVSESTLSEPPDPTKYNSWTVYLKDSLKLGTFAGFDIHSEEDLQTYFPESERGKWLRKSPQELTTKDIPSLLFDYQQLAAEHFMLIEQFQELQKTITRKMEE